MTLFNDLRFATRGLLRTRQTTLAVISVLAIVLGISTAVFTIVNAMTRGLPVEDADELVSLSALNRAGQELGVSYLDFQEWRQIRSLSRAGAYTQTVLTLAEPGHPTEQTFAAYISVGAFEILGERPFLGRSFSAADGRPGAVPVVMVGFSVWQGRYGGDPDVVGRSVRVNGTPATIIGVMPEGFRFPVIADVWQPLSAMPGLYEQPRDARTLQLFGRLANGVTRQSALAELETVAERLSREYPPTNDGIRGLITAYPGSFAPEALLLALQGAILFLLLAAITNVANASLQRTLDRSGQLAIHASLGASRIRLAGRVMVENAVISAAAAAAAYGIAVLALQAFSSSVAGLVLPYYIRWTMDARVLAFLVGAALATGMLCGLIPAWHVWRSNVNLSPTGIGRGIAAGSRRWATPLITAQIAVTFVLLAGAGLMMRSFLAVYRADLVIDAASLVETRINLPPAKYATPEQRIAFYDQLQERISAIPGIDSVAIATASPYGGTGLRHLSIDGRPESSPRDSTPVSAVAVGPTYFRTLGLELVSGRPFTAMDGRSGNDVAIINQRLATLHFSNSDPLGQRIRLTNPNGGPEPRWLTVVGVSRTLRQQFLQELDPVAYVPMRSNPPPFVTLLVRPRGEANVAAAIRQEIGAIDNELASSRVTRLDDIMAQSRWGHRVLGNLFTVFAVCALVLCGVGLYAVTAYSVTQRTKEIGVRLAVGAQRRDIIGQFLRGAAIPLVVGGAAGLGGALWVGRLLRTFLVQTASNDPLTLATIATVLAATTLLACVVPARRGARLDPVVALRVE
jgi:putative ABC transport system permease protein